MAVLLEDGEWKTWSERHVLSDLAYDRLLEDGLYIQSWPVRLSVWENPDLHDNPSLVRKMRRDARPLETMDRFVAAASKLLEQDR